jgi:hypothetical protein
MDYAAPVARSSLEDSVKSPNVEVGSVSSQGQDEVRCESEFQTISICS